MRRILTALTATALALSLVAQATPAQAAVPGYLSSYFGESAFLNLQQGSTGQFVAIFTNTGANGWLRNSASQVNLGVCLSDKTTCNVASPNAAWNDGSWLSNIAYATHSTDFVGPGQNGFFVYNVKAPSTATAGSTSTFNGDLVLASTLQQIRPEGYYQAATVTSAATGSIVMTYSYNTAGGGAVTGNGTATAPAGSTVTGTSATATNVTSPGNTAAISCVANDGAFSEAIEAITCTGDANGANANTTDVVKITTTASFSNGGTATTTNYVGDTTSPTVIGTLGTGTDYNRFIGTCPTAGANDTQTPITNTQYRVLNPDATTKIDWTSLPALDGAYNELCESLDFRADTTGFASGTYTLEVSANDSAGNRSRDTGCSYTPTLGQCQRVNLVVTSGADTTAPTCTITSAAQSGLKVTATGSAGDNVQVANVEVKVQRNDAGVWTDVTAYQGATADDGAFNEPFETWSFTTNDLTIPNNAPVQVVARVTDSAGNQNTCGPMALTTGTVPGQWNSSGIVAGPTDVVAPNTTITSGSLTPSNATSVTFSGTATDTGRGANNVTAVTFAVTDTAGNTVIGWTPCISDDGAFNEVIETFTCNWTLPSGLTAQPGTSYNILARATDAAGNTGTPASSTTGANSADEQCTFVLQTNGAAANTPPCQWIYDNNAPFISTSTLVEAGATPGKVDTGDTITLTFPEQLRGMSNTTPQSITLRDSALNTITLTQGINACFARSNTGDFHNATGAASIGITVGQVTGLTAVATNPATGAGLSVPSCTAVTTVTGSVNWPATIIGIANVRDWAGNSVSLAAGDTTLP